ncbi:MAG: hypothetical protein ACR2QZ_00700 [Woeseiaceae bacterium]
MNWESIGTIGEKVGILAIVVVLAYVILKGVVALLVDLVNWSNTDAQDLSGDPADQELSGDPANDVPGLHVLSEHGDQHRFIDENPTEKTIRMTMTSLNWVDGFHQVVLVTSPGVSLEVGGSLHPEDGLSSVYRDWKNRIHRVTKEPPTTVENMEDLLVSFHLGDGRWEQMYDYE